MPLALFRADASAQIGSGHLRRCFALSEAFRAIGWNVAFAVAPSSLAVVPELQGTAYHYVEQYDEINDIRSIAKNGCDLLIIDHYGRSATYEREFKGWADKILVIDDLDTRPHDCDILIRPTFSKLDQPKTGSSLTLQGPEYAPLRSSFLRKRWRGERRFDEIDRVFMNFGATDPGNLTAAALRGLIALNRNFTVDVVLGGKSPNVSEVKELAATSGAVRLHVEPYDIASIMAGADIAIGAGGTSSWERCCLGIPSIVSLAAENQTANIATLTALSAILVVSPEPSRLGVDLARTVCQLADDGHARQRMSRIAASICDGLGARRIVCDALAERLPSGEPIRLRPAIAADAKQIFDWQKAPEIRRFARHSVAPAWSEHLEWMDGKLSDTGCIFEVIEVAGAPSGIVRLDFLRDKEGDAFEVSILTAPGQHGKGIARGALKLAKTLVPEADIYAEVLPGNIASKRLFSAAGYKKINSTWSILPRIDLVTL